ncbi:MAG: CinA family nicotinamide mononucleotide deamidase-related protein [Paludibacteraceae bacterium]|nr:CinA family nicotinamide mononucleotide deamidase-related protein [Paludibacteraceae bacterium]
MRAEIITIGDELLIGQVVDTNSAWMAERLNEAGITLHQITSVHDDREHILTAIDEALSRADIVFTTGGLGPTKDDITKNVLCEYFHTSLVENVQVREHIYALYKERPEAINRLTATQWLVPESATILTNRVGSAPIMVFEKYLGVQEFRSAEEFKSQKSKYLIALPGVPHEMKIAMTEQVLPYIGLKMQVDRIEKGDIIHRTILLSGVPESKLAILIEDWEAALPASIHLAYLPKDGMIRLRLSSYGESSKEDIQAQIDTLLPLIGDKVLSVSDPSDFSDMSDLSVLAGQLLKQRGVTIATAESCTGGRLAAALNAQSGASAYYMGSVVAYDNTVKTNVLGVSQETLNTFGAVSEYTVREMAEGVRALMHTDFAIATSGIAGPLGGTEDKPVGTVWIAWATADGTVAECFHFGAAREREQITMRAVTAALVRLIRILNAGKYHVEA